MIGTVAAAFAVTIAVIIEILLPGREIYHAGWYNVALGALCIYAIARGRTHFKQLHDVRRRAAFAAILAGCSIAGFAGVVSGLFAPDNQTVVGAPGQRSRVESLGELVFPISAAGASGATVMLQRAWGGIAIGERFRDVGNFLLRAAPRNVVYVQVRDLRGNTLTVTQPSGAVFLSPVLLMEHTQSIAGSDLPFDSFNVPAARRVVKAVMFTADHAGMLVQRGAQLGAAAVLFDVDDENERPLPHGIGLSVAGAPVRLDSLILRGTVQTYPAVEVVAAPNLIATLLALLLTAGGAIALGYRRRAPSASGDDRANVSDHDAALG